MTRVQFYNQWRRSCSTVCEVCVCVYTECGGNLYPTKTISLSLIRSMVWLTVVLVRRDKDVCVLTVLNSCEAAAVMLCAHTEQPINYWDPRLKIAPRASGHASLACTQSSSLASPPGCLVSLDSHAGMQAEPPPSMACSSEVPCLPAEILLTHHPLGWQLQGAAVLHKHSHTSAHVAFTLCLYSVICMMYVGHEELQTTPPTVFSIRHKTNSTLHTAKREHFN